MKKVATTIKLEPSLYDEFKILGIHHRLTLQEVVEKCIYRCVHEDAFRIAVKEFVLPEMSSSLAPVQ